MGTPATRSRWVVFVLACAASALLYLHRYAWGVVKPFVKHENGFSATEVGWLDSAFQAAYAIGQVPGGMLGDRLGPRAVLSSLIVLWSLAAAAIVGVVGFLPLFGVRALFGLAQAGAYPTLSRLSRDWFPLEIRTSVQGALTALGRVGAALSSVILGTLLIGYVGLSWQTAILLLAVPGFPLAIAFWVSLRQSSPHAPREDNSPAPKREPFTLTRPAYISLTAMLVYAFASTFQDQLYVYWIPSFLIEGRGLDVKEMGLFTTLPLIGGAIGSVLGGMLNDALIRRMNRRWARTIVALSAKLVGGLLIVASVQVADGGVAMVVLLVARVFSDCSLPTQWGAITDMGGRSAATLFGVVNTVGAIGGTVAGPVLGQLKDHYGWAGLFYGVAAMCFVAALTWLFIDCTRRLAPDDPVV